MLIFFVVGVIVLVFLATVLFGAPYVPSLKPNLKKAFTELYVLTGIDTLVDIGSGGGVVLREASATGAHAVGFEINPFLYIISRFLSRKDKRVTIHLANHWQSHIPDDTTVVYIFSVDRDMNRLKNWLQSETDRLQKPINLISLGFDIKDMQPVKISGVYYLYIFNPLQ